MALPVDLFHILNDESGTEPQISGTDKLAMGMEMTAAAKALVWASIPADLPEVQAEGGIL